MSADILPFKRHEPDTMLTREQYADILVYLNQTGGTVGVFLDGFPSLQAAEKFVRMVDEIYLS